MPTLTVYDAEKNPIEIEIPFKIGDTIKMKSQGFRMTVNNFKFALDPATDKHIVTGVYAMWFDENLHLQEGLFPVEGVVSA